MLLQSSLILWGPSPLVELKKLNIHKKLWKVIENYFKDRLIEVETADSVVAKIPTRVCPQGSVLRHVFWDLSFLPCLEMLSGMQQVEKYGGIRGRPGCRNKGE